jgi:hypothetical protein
MPRPRRRGRTPAGLRGIILSKMSVSVVFKRFVVNFPLQGGIFTSVKGRGIDSSAGLFRQVKTESVAPRKRKHRATKKIAEFLCSSV